MKASELAKSVMMSSRLPFWKLLAKVDSGPKVERELRTFSNRLRRHQLGEGVISLNEHSTNLLSDMVCASIHPKCYFFPPSAAESCCGVAVCPPPPSAELVMAAEL